MKRFMIAAALGFFLFGYNRTQAQTSVNIGVNIGTPGPDDGFYYGGDYDYPDDYYSEYPSDYYPNAYYQDNYNDYSRSIAGINWNNLFVDLHLSTGQINAILVLNRRFPSFSAWDSFYRVNPMRWYYDRFYSLRRILSPAQFVIFQNRYYGGRSPIAYFNNYHRSYYAPRFRVMPRYRTVNIATYRRSPWNNSHARSNYGVAHSNDQRNNYSGWNNSRGNRPNSNQYNRNNGFGRNSDKNYTNNNSDRRSWGSQNRNRNDSKNSGRYENKGEWNGRGNSGKKSDRQYGNWKHGKENWASRGRN